VEAVPRVAFCERQTLHLDRGYDNGVVRRLVADSGIEGLVCCKGRARGTATTSNNKTCRQRRTSRTRPRQPNPGVSGSNFESNTSDLRCEVNVLMPVRSAKAARRVAAT
jgi:hypothetical protein